MFLFQTRANLPALRIKEPKLEADNARAVIRIYRLTPKEKALCRKKLDDLDGFLIYNGSLTTRKWLKSEIEPIIADKVKYEYLHEFLNGVLGKMIKRKVIYPELLDGFVRFVGNVNKNGIGYSELTRKRLSAQISN